MSFNYSDEQLNDLKQNLILADKQSFEIPGFWQEELQNALANREWERGNK